MKKPPYNLPGPGIVLTNNGQAPNVHDNIPVHSAPAHSDFRIHVHELHRS